MSIGHPIPEIQHFQNLTLKIQGQGHGWGGHWKSQHGSNILSTHILFISCQSVIPFLRYDFCKIWPWKSKVKVMGEGNVESHKVGVTSYRLTPFRFMSIGPSIPEIQHFQNLTLRIQGQGQMTMMLHNYRSIQFHRTSNDINPSSGFRDMGSAKSGPSAAWFDKFLAHGQAHMGQITMTLYNYRSRQVHETLNGVNPSSSFRDMRSAKSGPNLTSFWPMGKPKWGKWANHHECTTTGLDNSTELWMEKIRQAVTEIWVPQVWQPPARTMMTIPLQPFVKMYR